MLSDSSSESALLLVDSSRVTKFLKGEMWAKSRMPSSSMSMTGMSKLQNVSGGGERGDERRQMQMEKSVHAHEGHITTETWMG